MPTITNTRYKALVKKEKDLDELRMIAALEPFVSKFANNLAMLALNTPYKEWTTSQKLALEDAFKVSSALKEEYLARLPS